MKIWTKYFLQTVLSFSSMTVIANEITISCGAVGNELEICKQGVVAWEKKSGISVRIVTTPNSSSERLALYQQLLASKSNEIDVLMIDVVWPAMLQEHLLDLSPYIDESTLAGHFPVFVDNNRINSRLVAIPWFMDVGMLYYRKDLLERFDRPVPKTWNELYQTASYVQEEIRKQYKKSGTNKEFWGYLFQGRAYEGLTCNAVEWVASNGASLFNEVGSFTLNSKEVKAAFEMASNWVGNISPKGVLNYAEEDSRGVFQTGHGLFLRSWPYAWALSQGPDSPIKGKVGVAPIPSATGKDSKAVLGGWSLAVSRFSKNPKEAAELVKYLTSKAEQKRRALKAAYNPTMIHLYKDKEVLAQFPIFSQFEKIFKSAVSRPSRLLGKNYNRFSTEFWNLAHRYLRGQKISSSNLKRIEKKIQQIQAKG